MQDPNSTPPAEATQATNAPETGSNGSSQDKVAQLEAQLKDKDAKYLYLYAEFENFKKRVVKERDDLRKFGWENVAREMLQVIDNFERAMAHIPAGTDSKLVEGLQMIHSQFRSAIQHGGIQAIESVGKPFDPNLHDAVAQAESDLPPGTVAQEHVKGYTLHGRLLRPARVIVSEAKKN